MIGRVDNETLANLVQRSRSSERKRAAQALQPYDKDGIRVIVNCIQPGSYVQPHLHSSKYNQESEIWVPIQGRIALVTFNSEGSTQEIHYLSKYPNDCSYLEITSDTFHTAISLEADSIMLEFSRGPYNPQTYKNFARWAPAEEEIELATQYLLNLKSKLS